jgi:hypothetical protein
MLGCCRYDQNVCLSKGLVKVFKASSLYGHGCDAVGKLPRAVESAV